MNQCNGKKLLIILGDTLIDNNLTDLIKKGKNFVLTSNEFYRYKKLVCNYKKRQKT